MFSSVTNWFGSGQDEKSNVKSNEDKENMENVTDVKDKNKDQQTETKTTNEQIEENANDESTDDPKKVLEEASTKALNTAKEWGSYLYSFSKAAGKSVADQAMKITKTVEEKTFLGDFSKEQHKFVSEKEEKVKRSEAAVPPWIGYNEEEALKSQILALSEDKRNFVRNPPSGVQFQFDFDQMFPVAMTTLQEDKNLQKMRFELVPKVIKEEIFWRNYFYRVSLIKQSTQMTAMAQETDRSSSGSRRSSVGSMDKGVASASETEKDDFNPGSPPHDSEFVSDAFQENDINDEDIRKEMQMLGVDEKKESKKDNLEEDPQWEQELQQELQDYEMINEGGDIDDADIENEILQEIEQETKTV